MVKISEKGVVTVHWVDFVFQPKKFEILVNKIALMKVGIIR